MSGLLVDQDLCIGCGLCVKACGSAGIVVEGARPNRRARSADGCILCGACVQACPVGAISIERGSNADETAEQLEQRLASYSDIWVFAQVDQDGRALPVAFELVGRARELAAARGCSVVALLGQGTAAPLDEADRLLAAGANAVLCCRDDRLAGLDAQVFAHWICDLALERKPEIILYGATAFGRELAPGVAVRLQTGLTADCTVLDIDPKTGLLQQTRPAFGGNLMATIECPRHRPQMATVRPGIFAASNIDGASLSDACAQPDDALRSDAAVGLDGVPRSDAAGCQAGAVTDVLLDARWMPRVQVDAVEQAGDADTVADADVLVVVGRGIGSKKNVALAQQLADALGGKLGCTRPLVEAGWLEYWHQVGQTGASVSPKLLISLGVSGAIQHVAGTGGAQTVIAVNEDPDAPIFGSATYRVVGDCVEVARELIARLQG